MFNFQLTMLLCTHLATIATKLLSSIVLGPKSPALVMTYSTPEVNCPNSHFTTTLSSLCYHSIFYREYVTVIIENGSY